MKSLSLSIAFLILHLPLQAQAQSLQNPASSSPDFYKRFEGTIARQPVVMYLEREGGRWHGTYFYSNVQQPIPLWKEWSENGRLLSADSIIFVERPTGDTATNRLVLHYISPGAIEGSWTGGGKVAPVALKEAYTSGSYRFEPFWKTDSTTFTVGPKHQNTITSSFHILIPSPDLPTDKRTFVFSEIGLRLGCKPATQDIRECMLNLARRGCDSDRADVLEMAKDMPDSDIVNGGFMFEWFSDSRISVKYNEDDLLVLEEEISAYSGGAHESYAKFVNVIDVRNGKSLSLSDVTTADSITLQRLLEAAIRKEYHMESDQPLSDILFSDYLTGNNNFYITRTGLGFVYNPYEVASWADGVIEVFIPFSSFKRKLTPWFMKRMGL